MTETIYVLVYGQAEAGKSAFIQAISEINIRPAGGVEDESVPDFGRIVIEEGKRLIYLFANRGGKSFPELENLLNEEGKNWAYCVIVNPTKRVYRKRNYYQETKEIIEYTSRLRRPFLIIANRRKDVDSYSIGELCEILRVSETTRFLECDPVTEPTSVNHVLIELFKMLPEDKLVKAAIEKLSEEA